MAVIVKKKRIKTVRHYRGDMILEKEKNVKHFKLLIFMVAAITVILSIFYWTPFLNSEKIVQTPSNAYTLQEAANKVIFSDTSVPTHDSLNPEN